MSREIWIPAFDGKGRYLGCSEFAKLTGGMPPTLNADFLVYLEDGVVKGKDLRSGKEYGPSQSLSAVLNAIVSSTTGPVSILIGPGSYQVTEPIVLREGVTVSGSGREVTVLTGTGTFFEWDGAHRVTVENLSIQGSGRTGTGIHVKGDWDQGRKNTGCTIRNVSFTNLNLGLRLNVVFESLFDNLRFVWNNKAIVLEELCTNNTFRHIVIRYSGTGIQVMKLKYRCEGDKFDSIYILETDRLLEVRDGYVLTFHHCIFDYGQTDSFVYIAGGDWMVFDSCWFASQSAASGRVIVRPDYAGISNIRFNDCWFAFNKYFGVHVSRSGATGMRPQKIRFTRCVFQANGTTSDGGDVLIQDADAVTLSGCEFNSPSAPYVIAELGNPTQVEIVDCTTSQPASKFLLVANANRIRGIKGLKTEASGTATIPAGQTSISVTHGLAWTPKTVRVTPLDNLGGRSFWVSNVTATGFTINISSADTVNHSFAWEAEVGWV